VTGTALSELRESVGAALEGDGVYPEDATVLVDTVDSLTPPAYLLVWGTPWMVPTTFCVQSVRLDVVCIAGRIEPAPGIETLETMVAVALNRLRDGRFPEATVLPPGPFEIGGVRYLAARLSIDVRIAVPEPVAPGRSSGAATLTATAVLVAAGSTSTVPPKTGAAVLVSTATLTVTGTTAAPPASTGAATLTSAGTLTAAGSTSGTFSPASLPGIVGWWKGDDAATITAAGSPARVSAWANKAGAAGPLTQPTATNQPSSGTRTINGRNALDFNAAGSQHMVAAGVTPAPTYRYWAFVMTNDTTTQGLTVFGYGNGAAGNAQLAGSPEARTQPNPDLLSAAVAHHYGTGTDPFTVTGDAFIEIEVDTVAHTIKWWRNHVQQGAANTESFTFSASAGSPVFGLGFIPGAPTAWDGAFGEVFTTDTKPSAGDRANIDAYITARYSL